MYSSTNKYTFPHAKGGSVHNPLKQVIIHISLQIKFNKELTYLSLFNYPNLLQPCLAVYVADLNIEQKMNKKHLSDSVLFYLCNSLI